MKSFEECCVECQEQNPFFKLGGGVVGKFAYSRETPFIQPFESIESPWADFIKADSMDTNIKKLLKLAQKYKKETIEEKKIQEEEAAEEEVKPKPARKERTKSAPRPRRAAEPKVKGKEKVIAIDDTKLYDEEEPQGVVTRAQLEKDQSRWKSINASSRRLSKIERQELLLMAARLNVLTESGTNFQNVDRNLYKKLNEKFGTNFLAKSGIVLKR
jgi:hypothetical protein